MTQARPVGEAAKAIVVHIAWMGICGAPDDVLARAAGARPACRARASSAAGGALLSPSRPLGSCRTSLNRPCSAPLRPRAGPDRPYLIARAARTSISPRLAPSRIAAPPALDFSPFCSLHSLTRRSSSPSPPISRPPRRR